MLPKRKTLNHSIPSWVNDGAICFITICCDQRGGNLLCEPEKFKVMLEAFQHYESKGWYSVRLFTAMPDHIHLLIGFNPQFETKESIRMWKSFCAKKLELKWQSGFFDHRIRDDESLVAKAEYIVNNPVRAGLAERVEDWPYFYRAEGIWK